jgi:hypothetical protein
MNCRRSDGDTRRHTITNPVSPLTRSGGRTSGCRRSWSSASTGAAGCGGLDLSGRPDPPVAQARPHPNSIRLASAAKSPPSSRAARARNSTWGTPGRAFSCNIVRFGRCATRRLSVPDAGRLSGASGLVVTSVRAVWCWLRGSLALAWLGRAVSTGPGNALGDLRTFAEHSSGIGTGRGREGGSRRRPDSARAGTCR